MIENETFKGLIDDHDYGRNIKVSENLYERKVSILTIPAVKGRIIDTTKKKCTDEERKLRDDKNRQSAKHRAVESIMQMVKNQTWGHFATITFDPKKVDRHDFAACSAAVACYLKSLRRYAKYNKLPPLQYVVVAERHKNGAYHFHALIQNLPKERITRATHDGKELSDKAGRPIFNFDYEMGHTTVVPVGATYEDQSKVGSYITKYITKDLINAIKGKKAYWASHGMKRDNVICQGLISPGDMAELEETLHTECINNGFFRKRIDIKATGGEKHIFILRKDITNDNN